MEPRRVGGLISGGAYKRQFTVLQQINFNKIEHQGDGKLLLKDLSTALKNGKAIGMTRSLEGTSSQGSLRRRQSIQSLIQFYVSTRQRVQLRHR